MPRLLPILLTAVALALAGVPAAPAGAAPARMAPSTALTASLPAPPLAVRFGRGLRRPTYRPTYRRPSYRRPGRRPYRRPHIGHFFGNALRFLGIAYLAHMLFGIGAGGGSPLGLLIVLGV